MPDTAGIPGAPTATRRATPALRSPNVHRVRSSARAHRRIPGQPSHDDSPPCPQERGSARGGWHDEKRAAPLQRCGPDRSCVRYFLMG